MQNLNVAEMARELVERSFNSWTKSDKKKYNKILKKILRRAEKGYVTLSFNGFGDWTRVFKQLREDGFSINSYGGTMISWDSVGPPPELFPPQGGTGEVRPIPPKGYYITEGKDPRKIT